MARWGVVRGVLWLIWRSIRGDRHRHRWTILHWEGDFSPNTVVGCIYEGCDARMYGGSDVGR